MEKCKNRLYALEQNQVRLMNLFVSRDKKYKEKFEEIDKNIGLMLESIEKLTSVIVTLNQKL